MSQIDAENKIYFSKLVAQLEEWTRNGESEPVRKALLDLSITKIPREHRSLLANLSNRNSLYLLALRILLPVIRPKIPIHPPASLKEKLNFGNALNWVGATREAAQRIGELDPEDDPDVLIYLSFTHFSHWDYKSAIPLLELFVKSEKPTAYRKMVGKINLAASYIFVSRLEEAKALLNDLIEATKNKEYRLLHGNSHELAAQAYIFGGQYGQAAHHLESAEAQISSQSNIYSFFIRKWRSVMELMKCTGGNSTGLLIHAIRAEAATLKHWETIRECDLYLATKFADRALFEKVYFGTSWSPYREKMAAQYPHFGRLESEYLWSGTESDLLNKRNVLSPSLVGKKLLDQEAINSKLELDLNLGTLQGGTKKVQNVFSPGTLTHRLIQILSSDFYRPFRVGDLSAALFPEEFFHPEHSAKKVSNLVGRFRKIADDYQLPLRINVQNGEYMLAASTYLYIRVPREWSSKEKWQIQLERLRVHWPYQQFTSKAAQEFLKCSAPTARQIFKHACLAGNLVAGGVGRGKNYRFSK